MASNFRMTFNWREKHAEAPKDDQLPGPHAMQSIAPEELENFPAGQDVHIVTPVDAECEPFGQEVQSDAPSDAE